MTKKTIEGILNLEPTSTPTQKQGDLLVDQNNKLKFNDKEIEYAENNPELITQPFNDGSTGDIVNINLMNLDRAARIEILVQRGTLFEGVTLDAYKDSEGWKLAPPVTLGDNSGVTFSITPEGQVNYAATSTGSGGTLTYKKISINLNYWETYTSESVDNYIRLEKTLTKVSGTDNFNNNHLYYGELTGNQEIEFTVTGRNLAIGFQDGPLNTNPNSGYFSINAGIYFDLTGNSVKFIDGGDNSTDTGEVFANVGDTFKIVKTGNSYDLYKNGATTPFFTSTLSSGDITEPFRVGAAMLYTGTGFSNLTVKESAPTVNIPTATKLSVVQQPTNVQEDTVISPAITVQVLDQFDNPYSTVVDVTASIGSGTGTLSGTKTVQTVNGIATFDNLQVSDPDNFTLTFSSEGLTSDTSDSFTVSYNGPTQLAVTQEPTDTVVGDNISSIIVELRRADNSLADDLDATDPVTVTLVGGGTLSGTTTKDAINGIVAFNDLSVDLIQNQITLQFSSTSPEITGTATSTEFNIVSAPEATQLVISTQPADFTEINTAMAPIVVEARDDNYQLSDSTLNVTVAKYTGNGILSSPTTLTKAMVGGVVTFDDLEFDTSGDNVTLIFTATGLTPVVSTSFEIRNTTVTDVVIGQQPTNIETNAAIEPPVTVELRNDEGKVAKYASGSITATRVGGAGTLSGLGPVGAVNGIATFDNLKLDTIASNVTLQFTDSISTLSTLESNTFEVLATVPNQMSITAQPTNNTEINTIMNPITIEILGQYGQLDVVNNTTQVTVSKLSGSGALTGTLTQTASAGIVTFNDLQFDAEDEYQLEFTCSTLPVENQTIQSDLFNIRDSVITQMIITQQPPQVMRIDRSFDPAVTVELRNVNGNLCVANTDNITISVNTGTGAITPASTTSVTQVNGIVSFNDVFYDTLESGVSFDIKTPGDTVVVTTNSVSIVEAPPASSLVISSVPNEVAPAETFTLEVEVRDTNNELCTRFPQTVNIDIFQGDSTLSGTLQAVSSDGIATFTGISLNLEEIVQIEVTAVSGITPTTTGDILVIDRVVTGIQIIQEPVDAQVGEIAPPITVGYLNAQGNYTIPSGNFSMTASILAGTGTLTGDDTLNNSNFDVENRLFTFDNLSLDTIQTGVQLEFLSTIDAVDYTDQSAIFDVIAVQATKLIVTVQPTPSNINEVFTTNIIVQAQSEAGQLDTAFTGSVTASIASGIATLSGTTTQAAVGGVVTFNDLQINNQGTYTLAFDFGTLEQGVTDSFLVIDPTVTSLNYVVQPSTVRTDGVINPAVEVELRNLIGQRVLTSSDNVTIALQDGTGNITGTLTKAAVEGLATFDDINLDTIQNNATLLATSGSVTRESAPFSVLDSIVGEKLIITNSNTNNAEINTSGSFSFEVSILDNDNLVDDNNTSTIEIGLFSGSGNLTGTLSVDAVDGIANFNDIVVDEEGDYIFQFTSPGLTTTASSTIFVYDSTPSHLFITQQPSNVFENTAIVPPVTVEVRNQSNVPISRPSFSYNVSATLNTGLGNLTGTTSVNVVNGIATFNNLSLDTIQNEATLAFSGSGVVDITSNIFDITSVPASQLGIIAQDSTSEKGEAFSITVQVQGNQGQLKSDSNATIVANLVGGSFDPLSTTSVDAVNGEAVFDNLIINSTGNYTVAFNSTVPITLTGTTSNTITVVDTVVTQMTIETQPSNIRSDETMFPAVQVALRNSENDIVPVSGTSVSLSIGTGVGTLLGQTTKTTSNGLVSFNDLELQTVQTGVVLDVTSANLPTIQTSSFDVIAPPSATALSLISFPNSGSINAPLGEIRVRVVDAFNQTASILTPVTITATVSFGTSDFTLSSVTQVNTEEGIASFTNLIYDTEEGIKITFSATGLDSVETNAINIVDPEVTQMTIRTQPQNEEFGQPIVPFPSVELKNAGGTVVPTATNSVIVQVNGTGPLNGTTTKTPTSGIVTFNNLSLDTIQSGASLTFSSGGLTSVTSNTFDITSVPPTNIAVIQQPTNVNLNAEISPVTIQVRGDTGAVTDSVVSVTVSLVNPNGAILSGSELTKDTVNGEATFTGLSIDVEGPFRLQFTATNITTGTSSIFQVVDNTPTQIEITQQPIQGIQSQPLIPAPVVAVKNQFGRTITALSGTITVSKETGTGSLGGDLTEDILSGAATFDNLIYDVIESGVSLTFTFSGLTPVTSNTFEVIAEPVYSNLQLVEFSNPESITYTYIDGDITKVGGSAWNISIYSKDTVISGAAQLSFKIENISTNDYQMFGIQSAPLSRNDGFRYLELEVALYNTQGSLLIREGGGSGDFNTTSGFPLQVDDEIIFEIDSVGNVVYKVKREGIEVATATGATPISFPYNFVYMPFTSGMSIKEVFFEPSTLQTPNKLLITNNANTTVAGYELQFIEVTVYDEFDRKVGWANNEITATIVSGPGTLGGTTTINAQNGVAIFSDLIPPEAGQIDIEFSAAGLTSTIVTLDIPAEGIAWNDNHLNNNNTGEFEYSPTYVKNISSSGIYELLQSYNEFEGGNFELTFTLDFPHSGSRGFMALDTAPFATADSATGYNSTYHAILFSGTLVYYWKGSANQGIIGDYVDGDTFKIKLNGDTLSFYKNQETTPLITIPERILDYPSRINALLEYNTGFNNISLTYENAIATKVIAKDVPTEQIIGSTMAPIIVQVVDDNNFIDNDNVFNVTVTSLGPPGHLFEGTKTVTTQNGIATFDDLRVDLLGNYKLTFSVDGLQSFETDFIEAVFVDWSSYTDEPSDVYISDSTSIIKSAGTLSFDNNHVYNTAGEFDEGGNYYLQCKFAEENMYGVIGFQSTLLATGGTNLRTKIDAGIGTTNSTFVSKNFVANLSQIIPNKTYTINDLFTITLIDNMFIIYKNNEIIYVSSGSEKAISSDYPFRIGASLYEASPQSSGFTNISAGILAEKDKYIYKTQPSAEVGVGKFLDLVEVAFSNELNIPLYQKGDIVTFSIGNDPNVGSSNLIGETQYTIGDDGLARAIRSLGFDSTGTGFTLLVDQLPEHQVWRNTSSDENIEYTYTTNSVTRSATSNNWGSNVTSNATLDSGDGEVVWRFLSSGANNYCMAGFQYGRELEVPAGYTVIDFALYAFGTSLYSYRENSSVNLTTEQGISINTLEDTFKIAVESGDVVAYWNDNGVGFVEVERWTAPDIKYPLRFVTSINKLTAGIEIISDTLGITTYTSGIPALESNPINVIQTPSILQFQTQPTNSTAGGTLAPFTVEVQDATGNIITSATNEPEYKALTWEIEQNSAASIALEPNRVAAIAANASWNNIARSFESFASGDCFVEFTIDTPGIGGAYMLGLQSQIGALTATYTGIDFAVYIVNSSSIQVYENGTFKFNKNDTTILAGDVVKVAIESGIVNYYLNNQLFYTSVNTPNYPMAVGVSFRESGSSASNIKFSDGVPNTWTNVTLFDNQNVMGGTLTKPAINGVATFDDITLDRAGNSFTLKAYAGDAQEATSNQFDITASVDDSLEFVQQPENCGANTAMRPNVVVAIKDQYGNLTNSSASVTLNLTGASGVTGNTVSAVNGLAVFENLTLNTEGSDYFFTATSGALTTAQSNNFNIYAQPSVCLGNYDATFVESQLKGFSYFTGTSFGTPLIKGVIRHNNGVNNGFIVWGAFTHYNGTKVGYSLVRLDDTFNLDTTFDNNFKAIGTGLGALGGGGVRSNTAGFTPGVVVDVKVHVVSGEERIIAICNGSSRLGGINVTNSGYSTAYFRLFSNGTLDTAFNSALTFESNRFSYNSGSLSGIAGDSKIRISPLDNSVFMTSVNTSWDSATSGVQHPCLIKLTESGTFDTNYFSNLFSTGVGFFIQWWSIDVDSNGNVYLGSNYGNYLQTTYDFLLPIDSNGFFRQSFMDNLGGTLGTSGYPLVLSVDSNDNLYIHTSNGIVRKVDNTGVVDGSYLGSGSTSALVCYIHQEANGNQIWIKSNLTYQRRLSDGSVAPNQPILPSDRDIIATSLLRWTPINDTEFFIAGEFRNFNDKPRLDTESMSIYNPNDGIELFSTSIEIPFQGASFVYIDKTDEEEILHGGVVSSNEISSQGSPTIWKIDETTGLPDINFTLNLELTELSYTRVTNIQNNRLLFTGNFSNYGNNSNDYIACLNNDGTLDNTFMSNAVGFNGATVRSILLSDGGILIFGSFTGYKGKSRRYIVKLNQDGTEDVTFYQNFSSYGDGSGLSQVPTNLEPTPDGGFIIAYSSLNLSRYFGGKIMPTIGFLKFDNKGNFDEEFYTNHGTGSNLALYDYSIAVLDDGSILASTTSNGLFSYNGTDYTTNTRLIRILPNGNLDVNFLGGFGSNFGPNDYVYNIVKSKTSDRIYCLGSFTSWSSDTNIKYIVALNSNTFAVDTLFQSNINNFSINNFLIGGVESSNGNLLLSGNVNYITLSGETENRPLTKMWKLT